MGICMSAEKTERDREKPKQNQIRSNIESVDVVPIGLLSFKSLNIRLKISQQTFNAIIKIRMFWNNVKQFHNFAFF